MTTKEMTQRDADFVKAVENIGRGKGLTFADSFDRWLDVSLSMLCGNPNERQRQLWKEARKDEETWKAYAEALEAYGKAADGYHDPLGNAFMEKISHGQNGQFFTPESLCGVIASVAEIDMGTINDPTCGSGRLLLAALKKVRERGEEPRVTGQDLSYMCARMTLMNLLFNVVEGEVRCGNTLLEDYENFTFFHIEKVVHVGSEKVLSQYWQYTLADYNKVDEERKEWYRKMAIEGWFRHNASIERWLRENRERREERPEPDEMAVEGKQLAMSFF